MFLRAVADVARARGMSKLAQDSGLGRESLYKALPPGSKPRYEKVSKILTALNVKIKLFRHIDLRSSFDVADDW